MTYKEAVKAITAFVENYACGSDLDGLREAIEALKAPHGKWKNRNGNTTYPFWERYECSECNSISGGGNFCNHCGADMRKEGEAE